MVTRMRDWDAVPGDGGDTSSPVWSVIRWHLKFWVLPIVITTILYLLALGLAKRYAISGDLLGVGTVMFITMFVILVIGYALGLVGIHYGYRFLRGQVGAEEEGKERGLSMADGFREMEKHKGAHKTFVHSVVTYAAIPFLVMIGLGWFDPSFVAKYGPALLLLSFPAVILVTWLNPGQFIARLTQFLVIAVMLIIFGVAIWKGSQLKIGEYQSEQAASAPINERADREAKEAKLSYLREQAASCAKAIAASWKAGKPPTSEAEADCRKKQEAAREAEGATSSLSWPSLPKFGGSASQSTAAGQINNYPPAQDKAPVTAPAATPAPTAAITVAWEGYYAPSVHRGPMSIGSHPAGQYRVEGEGLRQQVDPNNHGHYRSHNWRGEVVSEGGRCIVIVPNPGQMSIPFTGPGQCYGAVIVTAENSTHHWVADRKCFDHRGGELFVNANNGAHPDRFTGQGGHKLRLTQC